MSISNHTKNELVFKGGTCLYKFYKFNRFSEDIDFSALSPIDLIPDFIPIIGHLDDIIIVPAMLSLAVWLTPKRQIKKIKKEMSA